MESLRRAKLFDGVDPDTGPYLFTREKVADPDERKRLALFLSRAPVIRRASGLMQDLVDRERGVVAPLATATDGTWIWEPATLYYLEVHGYGPDPEFYNHIRSQEYAAELPDERTVIGALEFMRRYEAAAIRTCTSSAGTVPRISAKALWHDSYL